MPDNIGEWGGLVQMAMQPDGARCQTIQSTCTHAVIVLNHTHKHYSPSPTRPARAEAIIMGNYGLGRQSAALRQAVQVSPSWG